MIAAFRCPIGASTHARRQAKDAPTRSAAEQVRELRDLPAGAAARSPADRGLLDDRPAELGRRVRPREAEQDRQRRELLEAREEVEREECALLVPLVSLPLRACAEEVVGAGDVGP